MCIYIYNIYTYIFLFINNSYKHHFRIAQKSHSTVYHTSNYIFFGAHNSFHPAGAMIQRLAILAVHLSYVCAAFGNKKKVREGPKPHIWQNKNSNDTQDHFTRSSPEIEFESVGVVVTVAVVTGNSGAPLLSIFR